MERRFENLDKFIAFLRDKKVGEATLSARVATTTTPGGEQVAFRGRIVAHAKYGRSSRAEYSEQLTPHVTSTGSPDLPMTEEGADALRAAQLTLARQLRLYREEYRAVVAAAREALAGKLRQAGIVAVEPED